MLVYIKEMNLVSIKYFLKYVSIHRDVMRNSLLLLGKKHLNENQLNMCFEQIMQYNLSVMNMRERTVT